MSQDKICRHSLCKLYKGKSVLNGYSLGNHEITYLAKFIPSPIGEISTLGTFPFPKSKHTAMQEPSLHGRMLYSHLSCQHLHQLPIVHLSRTGHRELGQEKNFGRNFPGLEAGAEMGEHGLSAFSIGSEESSQFGFSRFREERENVGFPHEGELPEAGENFRF